MAEWKHLDLISNQSYGFSAIFSPYNAFHQAAGDLFVQARARSINIFAMSPFIRGWKLNQSGAAPTVAADLLLRWVSSQEIVDNMLVSMRRSEWVEVNL